MDSVRPRSGLGPYVKLIRPRQWTKNGFVLAGVVFAEQAFQLPSLMAALLTFAAFCALSGSIYAINDALDVEEDRKHPNKRHRPVASGAVPVRGAFLFSGGLAAVGLAVCFAVSLGAGLAALAYVLLQTAYTFGLKNVAILDVMMISAGFVLRALAGAAAVVAPISPWLIVCTGLLALFLGFSKRRFELASLGEGAGSTRRNLSDYSVPLLDEMMTIVVAATLIAYSLYTFTAYEEIWMMLSIPFVVYGIFRYMLLVHRDGGDNPDVLLLKDRPLQATLVLWLVVVVSILYFFN